MMVARAVYDERGSLILDEGSVLDERHLSVLPQMDISSILIQDPRVDDVIIVPLVSEAVEAKAVRLLRLTVDDNQDKEMEGVKLDLLKADRLIKEMVQGFYSVFMGDIGLEGCTSAANFNYVHPVKVAALSLLLGKEAGCSRSDLVSLGIAALMQNISYVFIPQNVLEIMDPWAVEKSERFRRHPELSSQIVSQSGSDDTSVAVAISQHHERWDGSGYPLGLKGEEISLLARIMAIASTYHTLISCIPQHEPYFPPEAAEYIAAYGGELFDPELVQVFFRSVPFYVKGQMVRLNEGEVGIVSNANVGYVGRPVVRVCYERDGEKAEKPYDLDMSQPENQNKMIVEILDSLDVSVLF